MSIPKVGPDSPAGRVIRLLGLIDVAYECGLTTDAVRKWASRKTGYIPAQYQAPVLRLARRKDVELRPEDVIVGLTPEDIAAFQAARPVGAAA